VTSAALQVVHDTNVVLSALLFGGKAAQLRTHWRSGAMVPVVCQSTVAELLLILRYPKFKLTPTDIDALLEDYLPYAQIVTLLDDPLVLGQLPMCRDPKDQMFLELAQASNSTLLVTGDADLLALRAVDSNSPPLNFTILTLTELFNDYLITP
jgi:putative PIN family toxin of toxin-antitoxin system